MAHPLPAAELARLNREGFARAESLEPRFVRVLEPILDGAADEAASNFARHATDHLTAAAGPGLRQADADALAGMTRLEARGLVSSLALTAAADITARSTMVAVYPRPAEAAALAEAGAEDAAVMHVTLCYLGEVEPEVAAAVAAALGRVAGTHPPLAGTVGGVASFDDQGNGHPSILLPDVPGLVELRQAVCEAVLSAQADYARNHGYMPHLTVAYRENGPEPPEAASLGAPLHFDAIHVVQGDVVLATLPLTGAPALTASADWSPPAANEVVDVDALVATLRTKTDPVRLAVVQDMQTPILEGAGISFDVTNPLTARVLQQSGSQIVNIAETTQLNAMRIIKASMREGLSIPDTAKAIRVGMREASKARATLIARTEIVGAANGGSLAAVEIVDSSTGQTHLKEWLTSPGAPHPRHDHYPGLDRQTRHLDATFDVGGHPLQHPGDPLGPPGEVCNCRCALAYTEVGQAEGGRAARKEAEAEMSTEDAVAYYSTPKAFDLNAALRSGSPLTPEQEAVTEALDRGFAPAPKGGLVVYRGVPDTSEVFGKAKPAAKQTLDLAGYTSVSTDPVVADDFASGIAWGEQRPTLMRIVIPEGTPVLRVSSEYEYSGQEYLLPRNVSLRVESVEGRSVTADEIDTGKGRPPVVNTSIASRPSLEDLHARAPRPYEVVEPQPPFADIPLPLSADPYVAGLQQELQSLGNKIGNINWYLKEERVGELTAQRLADYKARLKALERRRTDVRDLIANPDPKAELSRVGNQIANIKWYMARGKDTVEYRTRLGLLEARQKELRSLLRGGARDEIVTQDAKREAAAKIERASRVREEPAAAKRAKGEPPKLEPGRLVTKGVDGDFDPTSTSWLSLQATELGPNGYYRLPPSVMMDGPRAYQMGESVVFVDADTGVVIRSELAPGEDAALEAHRLQTMFAYYYDFPAAMRGRLGTLRFTLGRNPADSYWEKHYNMPGFRSAATGGGETITFWGSRTISPGTFDHEMGHVAGKYDGGPHSATPWAAAQEADMAHARAKYGLTGMTSEYAPHRAVEIGGPGVSSYGRVAIAEDWAESVRFWVLDRRQGHVVSDFYNRKTGVREKATFKDLFPNRWRLLEAWLGDAPV